MATARRPVSLARADGAARDGDAGRLLGLPPTNLASGPPDGATERAAKNGTVTPIAATV